MLADPLLIAAMMLLVALAVCFELPAVLHRKPEPLALWIWTPAEVARVEHELDLNVEHDPHICPACWASVPHSETEQRLAPLRNLRPVALYRPRSDRK
jgi:hypothetical protein